MDRQGSKFKQQQKQQAANNNIQVHKSNNKTAKLHHKKRQCFVKQLQQHKMQGNRMQIENSKQVVQIRNQRPQYKTTIEQNKQYANNKPKAPNAGI